MTRPALQGLPRLYDPDPATEDTEPAADVASRIRSFFDEVLTEIEAEERGDEEMVDTRRFYRHGV